MKKKIVITALTQDEGAVMQLMKTVRTYGMEPGGHFWQDDLNNLSWLGPSLELAAPDCALWAILGPAEILAKPSVRTGLSLAALRLQAARGHGLPLFVLPTTGEVDPAGLPTPLMAAEVIPAGSPTLGSKLTARANMPVRPAEAEYRLDVHGLPGLGLWIEAGPGKGRTWSGAMLGITGAEIAAHGVGPAGGPPERCVLEYPMQGLKLAQNEREYTAWGVRNVLDERSSYYISVKGDPAGLVFGPLSEGDEAVVHTLSM
ncbi:hypothetical protein [Desulfocurvibacter africanus]|uniref:Uncharacterized protein n=1 Tax=Desulfocurvibacter africanus subsp. africanus str. Walvis Bay TaxID=690850 RepID=F3YX75_DESAF|nr:hypothetical protein [Desulfocurvibacter africanus]EGJ50573.1 hypothetical protein Desaf_2247 [Desulfocurvibacter africanus subsp. africanus str. Walvis Bay]